jgi:eukaryotic-like serine/threonine-protein kinase
MWVQVAVMSSERWVQIKAHFFAALDRAPGERKAFLAEACSDQELRKEIESLLANHEENNFFIDKPAFEAVPEILIDNPSESLIGCSIGRYTIERFLGRGGMGEVFLARDCLLGRHVALKTLSKSSMADAEHIRRFKQEARAASTLNHPNIVTVHEIGEVDGMQFIAAEFIEGETLRERMSRERMKLSEIIDIVMQTANALAVAHQAGIAHRDVKPENIMLRRDGFVKVVDFGLAKLTEAQDDSPISMVSTSPGIVMGTVRYMSPEQARGVKTDTRTDIFSLGVVFYEMITGRLPFDGETNSDVIASILTKDAASISDYVEGAPKELKRIIKRVLMKERENRYQKLEELLAALEVLKSVLRERQLSGEYELPLTRKQGVKKTIGQNRNDVSTAEKTFSVSTVLVDELRASIGKTVVGYLKRRALIATSAGLIVLIAVFAMVYQQLSSSTTSLPVKALEFTKLTTSGYSLKGRISPNGKYLTYTILSGEGQSVWIKELATGNERQIVAPANISFWDLNFSRNGDFVYYLTEDSNNPRGGTLNRAPTLGGPSQKVMEKLDGFSLSPDDKRIAFIRHEANTGENELLISDIDGKNERKLARRKIPNRIMLGIDWSPDGKLIAAFFQEQEAGTTFFKPICIAVDSGLEQPLTKKRWSYGNTPVWLLDGSSLIVVAKESGNSKGQLWRISYPSGEVQKITNDSNDYSEITITADGRSIVAVMNGKSTDIWAEPVGDAGHARRLTNKTGEYRYLSSTPDGKILFTPVINDHCQIFIMDADGGMPKQLTSGASQNLTPVMSAEGKYIVFVSTRTGSLNLWRMDSDGGNPRQLTSGGRDSIPEISPDGKWVYYMSDSSGIWSLYKVSIEGGEAIKSLELGYETSPVISPDGRYIAYEYINKANGKIHTAIASAESLEVVKSFDLRTRTNMRWSRDGKGITYVENRVGGNDIWFQPIDGGSPKRLTDIGTDEVIWFDWSPDGKLLLYARGNWTCDMVMLNNFR